MIIIIIRFVLEIIIDMLIYYLGYTHCQIKICSVMADMWGNMDVTKSSDFIDGVAHADKIIEMGVL